MKAYLYDVFHRCESITDWNASLCTLTLSSAQKIEGNYSIKMTADNDQMSNMRYDRTVNWSAFLSISFSVYHLNWTNETGRIALYTDAANYKYWNFDFAAEWTLINVALASAPDGSAGTLDLSNINYVIVHQRNQNLIGEDFYFDFFHGKTTDITSDITYCKIVEEMYEPSFADLKIKGTSLNHFQAGLEMEIYDKDDVLSWTGRILYPESVLEGTQVVGKLKALGTNSAFNNAYRKNFTTARDSDYIVKNIIDNALAKFTYHDEIDNFTLTYKYDLKNKIQKMFKYLATLERAVIHYLPDGEIFFNKYDNLSKGPQIYQGTYNFEDDAVGTSGDDITGISTSATMDSVVVEANYLGHKKVVHFSDAGAGSQFRIIAGDQVSGTLEGWVNNPLAQDWYVIGILDVGSFQVRYTSKTNIACYHGDGAGGNTTVNTAVVADSWNRIKVYFNCTTDKWSCWINEVLRVDDENFLNDAVATSLDFIQIYSADACEGYIDAIGMPGDANYDVGDNLKCWDESTSKIKILNYTPSANRHITRTPVIGANNDLGQVYYVGKATDAAVQKYGINQLQPWRDPEITNYAEAKQLGDNLLAIYSLDTQMISMLVVGKGHLQVGKTLNLGWAGVFSITQGDFLLTKRTWYPTNDISELELTDNVLTKKAFNVRVINKFYDEDAQQSYDEPDVAESTIDGTVEVLYSLAQLRSPSFLSSIMPQIQLPTWPTALTAMTRDGNWHDVDISATYGAKKHLVFLYIHSIDTVGGQPVALRPKGSASIYTMYVQQTAIAHYLTVAVQTDSAGVFQYKVFAAMTNADYAILAVLTP